jgi:hypothetical protein
MKKWRSGWVGHWDMGMGRKNRRLFIQFALLALTAAVMPAMAAGLAAGASAGTQALTGTIYPSDDIAGAAIDGDASPYIATHAPTKLSVLVGNDAAAMASAHSVHVDFRRSPK